jgi:hypothetical protein
MPFISTATTEVEVHIAQSDAWLPYPFGSDVVDEQDLIGTERTMVTRTTFGSEEVVYDIKVYSAANWAKLEAIRKSQAVAGTVVSWYGLDYDLQFRGSVDVVAFKDTQNNIYRTKIRLKRV